MSWGVTTGLLRLDCLSNSGAAVGHAVEQAPAQQDPKRSASNKVLACTVLQQLRLSAARMIRAS